jgi:hypothetical protein
VDDAVPPGRWQAGGKLIQTPARVLVQIGVPGRDQRNPQGMRGPKSQDPEIPWPGDVHQVGSEQSELIGYPILIPAQQRVAAEFVVNWERRQASLQL